MDRNLAAALMEQLVALSAPLNALTELSFQIPDAEERSALRKAVGGVMGIVYTDLMRPLIRQYPDLDPDRESPDRGPSADG